VTGATPRKPSTAPQGSGADAGRPVLERGAGTTYVQSLQRGLEVIKAFDHDHPRLTLSDVARRADLTRAAARRFLHTLVELGYVGTDGKTFALRARVLELGYAFLSSLSLPELAQPHMQALVGKVEASCSMSVLDGEEVFYIGRVPTKHRLLSVTIPVGTRFPAYATAMGRVLLAAKPDDELDAFLATADLQVIAPKTVTDPTKLRQAIRTARRQGYAIVEEELREGLASVAVPVHLPDGSVAASLNLSTHDSRGTAAVLRRELLPELLETAGAIEADLRLGRP
jgi:IclR family pca regulon transcriptional regulator